MSTSPKITVSEYNQIIKSILESEILLKNILITGEITNLREYKFGKQLYFNLIDENSSLPCVLYDTYQKNINFPLKDGLKVTLKGALKVFHKKGAYTLQVVYMEEEGKGDTADALEKLKAKLLKEGLFEPKHKKPIPLYPEHIALITAEDSAAFHDFTKITKETAPHIKLTLIPAIMQGPNSPKSLITALNLVETLNNLETIIILRGGGSAEDLAGYNNESLVRKIFGTTLPIISAVGHEIDHTLTDFASDHRSPTPTAAAHHITEPYQDFKASILQTLKTYPQRLIQKLHDKKNTLLHRLELANPLHKLAQGYTITTHDPTQKPLHEITPQIGDTITTQTQTQKVHSKITKLNKKNKSPLDIPGIDTDISTNELLGFIKKSQSKT